MTLKSLNLDTHGWEWLSKRVDQMIEDVEHISPVKFNEENRYLPASVTPYPGFIDFDLTPFMREIIECFSTESDVREVNLKKGVQVGYTTALESGMLYFMAHIKNLPIMYFTADKELAKARIEINILPMLNQSGFSDIIRSSDINNSRKTGKTKDLIEFSGGGYLVPFGANNANKMRQYSGAVLIKDEIDAWPDIVGKDGDPDKLTDARAKAFWAVRKIFRGSTPLLKHNSKICSQHEKGDQRKYMVHCKHCGHEQYLKWSHIDKETGVIGGFRWDLDQEGHLIQETVRYCCTQCGEPHYEYDKEKLFSEKHGAYWKPHAKPTQYGVRSYHLPAFYSKVQPWYACVQDYISAYDVKNKKVRNIGEYQSFYNNILGEAFEVRGSKVSFQAVSAHRRANYHLGKIPNVFSKKYCGSKILLLTCTVDVQKRFLAVAILGWTKDARCFLIDYYRINTSGEMDCTEISSPVWSKLREQIEETTYFADDKTEYQVALTLIDAGYSTDTVSSFCSEYASGVYPIIGRDRPSKYQNLMEFGEFSTRGGLKGYRINVDHYKDRLSTVLRREWYAEEGEQNRYHFNAPVDTPDKALKELTVETKRQKKDEKGVTSYYWHRPSGADNELWDCLVYGHAGLEIMAWQICIQYFELETVDWAKFWQYLIENEPYSQSI